MKPVVSSHKEPTSRAVSPSGTWTGALWCLCSPPTWRRRPTASSSASPTRRGTLRRLKCRFVVSMGRCTGLTSKTCRPVRSMSHAGVTCPGVSGHESFTSDKQTEPRMRRLQVLTGAENKHRTYDSQSSPDQGSAGFLFFVFFLHGSFFS